MQLKSAGPNLARVATVLFRSRLKHPTFSTSHHPTHHEYYKSHAVLDRFPSFRIQSAEIADMDVIPICMLGSQRTECNQSKTNQWLAVIDPLSSIRFHCDQGLTLSSLTSQIRWPQMTYLRRSAARLFITHSAMGSPAVVLTWGQKSASGGMHEQVMKTKKGYTDPAG